jgi:hypothetical protein
MISIADHSAAAAGRNARRFFCAKPRKTIQKTSRKRQSACGGGFYLSFIVLSEETSIRRMLPQS